MIGGVGMKMLADSLTSDSETASSASAEASPPVGGGSAAVEGSRVDVFEPPAVESAAFPPPTASARGPTPANASSSSSAPRPKQGAPPAAKTADVWGYD